MFILRCGEPYGREYLQCMLSGLCNVPVLLSITLTVFCDDFEEPESEFYQHLRTCYRFFPGHSAFGLANVYLPTSPAPTEGVESRGVGGQDQIATI